MTTKQKRFCQEYLIDLNATQAAIRAGYSEKSAYSVGQRILKNVEVKKYIVEQMERLKNEKISSAQEVLEYLTSVMRGEQKEQVPLMYYDKQILEEKSASIKDRLKAAELLGKRYALFTEKLEVEGATAVQIVDNIPSQEGEVDG
ncbi:MAG: terminase small subunit [Candidatus Gastranaerophilales bacterium]|nr:terminase small subunit [Candidatus Gastranaerophilales bacterium]